MQLFWIPRMLKQPCTDEPMSPALDGEAAVVEVVVDLVAEAVAKAVVVVVAEAANVTMCMSLFPRMTGTSFLGTRNKRSLNNEAPSGLVLQMQPTLNNPRVVDPMDPTLRPATNKASKVETKGGPNKTSNKAVMVVPNLVPSFVK